MKISYESALLALALPAFFANSAVAQTTGTDAPYALTGTSISGAGAASKTILTAPVVASSAAIKTEAGLYLYPSLLTGYGRNTNINSSATSPVASNFVNVAPKIIGEMKNNGDRYTAVVSLDSTNFDSSSADNFTNSEITLAGDNYFTPRARLGWSVGQVGGNDARGSKQTGSNSPEAWRSTNLDGRFIYGAAEASGRLEVDLGTRGKVYDKYALGNMDQTLIAGRALYRLGTRTMALTEVRQSKSAYTSSLATDSNTERQYYVGLTWEATAATTGIVKVGTMTKDFDAAGKSGYNGGSWEATVRWLPLTYSQFELQSARSTADSSGVGNFEIRTSSNLSWNHKWTQSLVSRASLGVLNTEFTGANRTDTANTLGLAMDYSVLRWLKLGVDLANTDNSSNTANGAFKRNVFMFTLNASL
jgi:polysaccharide biosynthesis protein VpsM